MSKWHSCFNSQQPFRDNLLTTNCLRLSSYHSHPHSPELSDPISTPDPGSSRSHRIIYKISFILKLFLNSFFHFLLQIQTWTYWKTLFPQKPIGIRRPSFLGDVSRLFSLSSVETPIFEPQGSSNHYHSTPPYLTGPLHSQFSPIT